MRRGTLRLPKIDVLPAVLAIGLVLPLEAARAQPMQPGEAFVTRFSGATDGAQPGEAVIDPEGTVGSIVDVRSPGQPPQGHHWIDEPQRAPLKASDVGQIFGVALDGQNPPNIYVTATAAFGLHRTSDNSDWMPGMWGPGGPGAVYKLDSRTGRPALFARLTLSGRQNTGAALGNIAYDSWNRQFFVSDLETGMIHRLRATDGSELSIWDHGAQARADFLDAENGQRGSLPAIPFNPASAARINDCPSGSFSTSSECWNIATSGRRVWGLGVSRDAKSGAVRLYYSVGSSPAFGNDAWNGLPEDQKRNSVWSVQLGPDGEFAGDVRREFLLPDFFQTADDIARAGYSHPVSDITFPVCSNRGIMLVAERGGLRNLGFSEPNPFADPHEARLLRYELDHEGIWRAVGRYDVGFRQRQPEEGPPAMQANCAGGAAFGYGYDPKKWTIARNQPDQFVWTTGDALCSALGPCNAPGIGETGPTGPGAQPGAAPQQASETEGPEQAGDVEVHGVQGIAESAFQPLAPAGAYNGGGNGGGAPGQSDQTAPGSTLNETYMIDADVNIDETGNVDAERTLNNDATWIGDVAIYQVCETPPTGFVAVPPPPAVGIGHDPQVSHSMYESHGRQSSHFRFGSHSPYVSHNRWQSHYRNWSHYRDGSHNRAWSHERRGSIHNRYMTHLRYGSPHDRRLTHQRLGTPHDRILTHRRYGSPHDRRQTHQRYGSPHDRVLTHKRQGSPPGGSHLRIGSPHNRAMTHQRTGTPHNRVLSHQRKGSPHDRAATHKRLGSVHSRTLTHKQQGSQPVPKAVPKTVHTRAMTHATVGSQKDKGKAVVPLVPKGPQPKIGPKLEPKVVHTRAMTHARVGSPKQQLPKAAPKVAPKAAPKLAPKVTHAPAASHARTGSRRPPAQQKTFQQKTSPQRIQQPRVQPKAIPQQKKAAPPAHTRAATHQRTGSKKK